MTPSAPRGFTCLALAALAVVLGGCVGFVAGYGETPVYGGYGYVGPWESGPVVVEGGHYAPPPYFRADRDRREEDSRRRAEVAPERRPPEQRAAPRPIPSIPNQPRPPRQREGNPQR
ncbi:MAG TPA: hypothetical protein VMD08_02505 [Candidatus Baltobacteraceae bacterium]|nr:hypothetical protein [Candidatus Baltobacteraceae bacterium]